MQVESVRAAVAVEREDEHQVGDLATEVQVHRVSERNLKLGRSPEEGKSVWLQEQKKAVYRVIEAETGEIIQQVLSDEFNRVARNIEEFLIFDAPQLAFQSQRL